SIDLTPTGGSSPYTYSWSNGATTQDLTGLGAGTYTVTLTDANGCTATTTVILTEPGILGDNFSLSTYAGGFNVTCVGNDGSIDLTVSGGATPYTYSWNNGATSEDLTNLSAGKYIVTITDVNGCSVIDSATLVQTGNLAVVLNSPPFGGTDEISC